MNGRKIILSARTVETGRWHELRGGQRDLQSILQILLDYDERSGSLEVIGSMALHFMRRSVGICRSESLRVFALSLGGNVFYLVAEVMLRGGYLATSWIHEDGIYTERRERRHEPEHAVHSVLCLTDLVLEFGVPLTPDQLTESETAPGEPALDLMFDAALYNPERREEAGG